MLTHLRFVFCRMRTLFLILFACFFSFGILQAAPVRIVAYGDSGVAGKGVPKDEAYPAQLEGMLRKKGFDVSVTNAGVNGRTSSDALTNLDAAVPAGTAIVIVQFGVNDVKHGVAAEAIRKNMDAVVGRLNGLKL
jgi:acyl-CoA thioesterase-1